MNWLLIVAIIMFISFGIALLFNLVIPSAEGNKLCYFIEFTWNGTDWEQERVYTLCKESA